MGGGKKLHRMLSRDLLPGEGGSSHLHWLSDGMSAIWLRFKSSRFLYEFNKFQNRMHVTKNSESRTNHSFPSSLLDQYIHLLALFLPRKMTKTKEFSYRSILTLDLIL